MSVTIQWTNRRRVAVSKILAAYPKESARCDMAAKEIFPHAQEQDPRATVWRVQPRPGLLPFLILAPKVSVGGGRWRYHVAVEAEAHCVDALTQVDGTEKARYLDAHFHYADQLEMIEERSRQATNE